VSETIPHFCALAGTIQPLAPILFQCVMVAFFA
jgi:hypothetical protein